MWPPQPDNLCVTLTPPTTSTMSCIGGSSSSTVGDPLHDPPSWQIVDQVYGEDADLYHSVLQVAPDAPSAVIQAAFFERRRELIQALGVLESPSSSKRRNQHGSLRELQNHQQQIAALKDRLTAIVFAGRVLGDASFREQYDLDYCHRIVARNQAFRHPVIQRPLSPHSHSDTTTSLSNDMSSTTNSYAKSKSQLARESFRARARQKMHQYRSTAAQGCWATQVVTDMLHNDNHANDENVHEADIRFPTTSAAKTSAALPAHETMALLQKQSSIVATPTRQVPPQQPKRRVRFVEPQHPKQQSSKEKDRLPIHVREICVPAKSDGGETFSVLTFPDNPEKEDDDDATVSTVDGTIDDHTLDGTLDDTTTNADKSSRHECKLSCTLWEEAEGCWDDLLGAMVQVCSPFRQVTKLLFCR